MVLSGPLGAAADAYAAGDTYFQSINSSGGINGRKLKVLRLDDGYDPKRAVANVTKLVTEDKVFALSSVIGTGATLAVLPITEKAGVPLVAPYTGADVLRSSKFKHLYLMRASYANEADKMAQQLATIGVKKIALIYQDDPFGKAGLKVANEALERQGLKASAVGAFEISKMNIQDATDPVLKTEPAAVILLTAGNGAIGVIKALQKAPQPPQIYCLSVVQIDLLNSQLGEDARGIIVAQVTPSPWRSSTPLIKEYQQMMLKASHKEFS